MYRRGRPHWLCGDVEKVWTPWSARTVEFGMFLTWPSFFVLSTFLFGLTLSYLNRSGKKARP